MMTNENHHAGFLRPFKKGWMAFARLAGWCTTHLLLTLFFALLGVPALWMIVARRFSPRRPMGEVGSYWKEREETPPTLERARRQF